MSAADNFTPVTRLTGEVMVHKTKPVWIVYYSFVGNYRAYQVKDYELPLKKGRALWAHDNKDISPKDGFKTLDEAMEAVA